MQKNKVTAIIQKLVYFYKNLFRHTAGSAQQLLMNELNNNNTIKQTSAELGKIREFGDQLREDIEASEKSKETDDPFELAIYGPPSMLLTRLFIKLGWSPNSVTLLSLLFGVAGSFFFYSQNAAVNLIGIFIEYLAVVLDCCDGQIARITNNSSQLGRFLDGMVDTANFLAVYIVLAFRMMNETIPFTDRKWGIWIWIVLTATGLFHAQQARMADYYRGLHLSFIDNASAASFTSSKAIKKELSESKNTPLYNRVYLAVYYSYTKAQERMAPKAQKLLAAIRKNGGASTELARDYRKRSLKYIQITNILTYTTRAIALFILILFKLHHFYPVFVIIGLGSLMVFMIRRYEKIADDLRARYFPSR